MTPTMSTISTISSTAQNVQNAQNAVQNIQNAAQNIQNAAAAQNVQGVQGEGNANRVDSASTPHVPVHTPLTVNEVKPTRTESSIQELQEKTLAPAGEGSLTHEDTMRQLRDAVQSKYELIKALGIKGQELDQLKRKFFFHF